MIGKTFGDLIVTSKTNQRGASGEVIWKVKCRCGRSTVYKTSTLKRRVSCGICKPEERTNTFEEEARRAAKVADKGTFAKLPLNRQLQIVNEYCFGSTVQELSTKYEISTLSCRDGIVLFRERLNTMHELQYMSRIEHTKLDSDVIDRALAINLIEDSLKDTLSSDDSEELTLSEELYCYLYVYTGSNDVAIKESGLSKAIPQDTPIRRSLLGMFLREKPNLKEYIAVLKDARVEDIKASKQIVQHELINQVEQLKEAVAHGPTNPTTRGHLLRAIELLGKTVGAFEDRLTVTNENAADALDHLLEMAKAEVKALPPGTEVEETYEVEAPWQASDITL